MGAGVRLADVMVATLLAPVCVSCGSVLDSPTSSPVCSGCWRRLACFTPPVCEACGEPVGAGLTHAQCPLAGSALSRARALGSYDGVLRDLIHALKYDRRRSLASSLAAPLATAAADVLEGADALVPVPLHPWRAWTRGFNQAEDVARALGPSPPMWRLLGRRRATRPQSSLAALERRRNVAGAFRLAGLTRRGRLATASRASGRVLVLVDDVATTGATLDACASVLRAAGAREVRAVTLARALRT
jgi:ComF family protein